MRVKLKVSPTVIVEAEGKTQAEVFEQLAGLQETFSVDQCDKCKGKEGRGLRFVTREVDGNKFFELHCQDWKCRAKLSFGQSKEGGALYPRRKETKKQTVMGGRLEAGAYLPDNGWIRWNKEKECSE